MEYHPVSVNRVSWRLDRPLLYLEWLGHKLSARSRSNFHFMREYRGVVTRLLATHSLDEAMSLAVGGDFDNMGSIQSQVLRYAGLCEDMSLIDFGCGSGRLAAALSRESFLIDYYGIDIEQRLLDYARSKSPAHFRFARNLSLTIPAADASADMVCAFSVFTHLQHEETYLYLEDIHRVLRPRGRLVFSFIEFASPRHWQIFEGSVEGTRTRAIRHLNQFIERNVIDIWSEKLGYERQAYIDPEAVPWDGAAPLGQSVAILLRQ